MTWCEEHGVDYVLGFARNDKMRRMIEPEMQEAVRQHAATGQRAQATTIRLRLLKIGARIRITARKVWLSLSSSFPLQPLFAQAWAALRS